MMIKSDHIKKNSGSYRDPLGQVFHADDKILRTVTQLGANAYEQFKSNELFGICNKNNWLPLTQEVDQAQYSELLDDNKPAYVLQHETIPFISYPYEWSFSLLKAAALFHLKIHLLALNNKTSLSDASAFNVQFLGHKPIFIDILSFIPYQEGEYWNGHRQFCEQFLFPLLLRSQLGVAHNSLYRGNLEGILLEDISKLLPVRYRFSLNMQLHLYLPLYFQKKFLKTPPKNFQSKVNKVKLTNKAYIAMLEKLQRWIEKLQPKKTISVWGNYEEDNNYTNQGEQEKRHFIKSFMQKVQPALLFDLGCNSGEYSKLSLESGAGYVIGFDSCQTALEKSYQKSVEHNLNFLPLYMDITNPSPDLGWQQQERSGFYGRAQPNAIIALALIHHLIIGRNIPMEAAIAWLVGFAPSGVIEFIPKTSPVIQKMLMAREDIFPEYCQDKFELLLLKHAKIIDKKVISCDERILYWFEKW